MNERIFAIGDIHGHYHELEELITVLLEKADLRLQWDHLVLLGDLVDSGDNSKAVIEFAIQQTKNYPHTFHVLKGNHESLMLDALNPEHPTYGDPNLWWYQGGKETAKSYGGQGEHFEKALESVFPPEHINFLTNLPLYWQTDKYFFCHGGVRPGKKIDEIDFSDPQVLHDLLWIREEFYTSNFDFGKKVIFGHTAFRDFTAHGTEYAVLNKPNVMGINTMPRNFGHLTAVELPGEAVYQPGKI